VKRRLRAADAAAMTTTPTRPANRRPEVFVIFEASGMRWAAPVGQVREVLAWTEPMPLPGAPAGVLGVVKVRGRTLPVLTVPGLEAAGTTRAAPLPGAGRLLLVEVGGRPVVLATDSVVTVAKLAPGDGDEVPLGAERGVIALVEVGEEPTLTVDLDLLLAQAATLAPA
jgi:purine-binding chemotaxis protein CheW